MSDLEVLFPVRQVRAGGELLDLKPFTFGQIQRAAKLLQPVAAAVQTAGIFSARNEAGDIQFRLAPDWPLHIVELLAAGGGDLVAFVAFASGKPRDWVEAMAIDEGVVLTKAIFELNADFFAQRVLPLLGMVSQSDGARSSASSSQEAIVEPTSTDTPSDNSSSMPEPASASASA